MSYLGDGRYACDGKTFGISCTSRWEIPRDQVELLGELNANNEWRTAPAQIQARLEPWRGDLLAWEFDYAFARFPQEELIVKCPRHRMVWGSAEPGEVPPWLAVQHTIACDAVRDVIGECQDRLGLSRQALGRGVSPAMRDRLEGELVLAAKGKSNLRALGPGMGLIGGA